MPYVNNMYMATAANNYQANPYQANPYQANPSMQTSADNVMQKAMNVIDFKQDVVNNVVDPTQHNGMMMMQQNAMQQNAMQQNAMQQNAMQQNAIQQNAIQNAAMQNMAMQNMALQNTGMMPNQAMMQNQSMMQYPPMMQDPSMFQTPIPVDTTENDYLKKPTKPAETEHDNSRYSNAYYSSREFNKKSKSSRGNTASRVHNDSREDNYYRKKMSPDKDSDRLSSTFPRTKDSDARDIINRRMVTDIVSSALRDSGISTTRTAKKR